MLVMKFFFNLFLVILFANKLWCSDYLMYIGAGGEPKTENTIFDKSILNIGNYTKSFPNLKVEIALNGGHSKTVELINKSIPNAISKSDFTSLDYKRLIQNYKSKLENNEIVEGDQFMIYINSHGGEKNPDFKTHEISTSEGIAKNLNTLKGSTLVDLDQLEILIKLAENKGVKIAIIDMSCHSGNSLALGSNNTCVITSSGPNHYGYGSFSEIFSSLMTEGKNKNLEEIFLETRAQEITPSFPMISTQAGVSTNSLLYNLITPYFYYFDISNDKITPYLKKHSSTYNQCMEDRNYNSLISTTNSVEELNTTFEKILWWTIKSKNIDLSYFKELLEEYKGHLDLERIKIRKMRYDRLDNIETIGTSRFDGHFSKTIKQQFRWKDLIVFNFEELITMTESRIRDEKDLLLITNLQQIKSFYLLAQKRKKEILKTNPDLLNIINEEEKGEKGEKGEKESIAITFYQARKIAIEERKLYSALYENFQKTQPAKEPNPCQNFKIR